MILTLDSFSGRASEFGNYVPKEQIRGKERIPQRLEIQRSIRDSSINLINLPTITYKGGVIHMEGRR